ncbi:MAG: ABC transporter substrate-binding protein [Candidatus Cloacimonadaceae bacterium]|jgi:ABC-type nitrate/sulfonate/bicarbonate transport system substrate-binding protein|nr:ABC transporter substrate-binding protein [Candidatus Cloacimonadota bacterium]MDY0127100.1 ABC transporter substrate-binding protein [Candidatus Cloacimonadaceae bacterium]MCB5255709.1 ABC transporter substrate-binding protein [Candidatus Cloacimonadota bacterium]MCK9177783.1 ABC transporter substrate-binding protein [Candidatus Cloacimonadota bacterium]MCK9241743.1 ABC transporter substrate-binding protein [Candidatus Cloacimonadota bacterium]
MKQIILTISLLLLMALVGCGKSQSDLEKISVTLDWTPNTNHTGLYVAQELGYFAQEGLEVQILQPGQGVTDQIVATGKSHFGVSYQENVIRARSEGIPLVSIAAVIQHNTSGFASLKEANISSVKDFEGKRYGSWDSPSELAILGNVMQAADADISKVEIISGIYDFFSTIGKDADFEWIYYGWDGVIAAQRGLEIDYIPLKDLNPVFDYYTPVLISSEDYLKANSETAVKFLKAAKKGYEYCIAEPEKAADILIKHVPELNSEQVQASLKYLANEYQAEAEHWGLQKLSVWESFANWMSDEKLISEPLSIDQAFTNEYLLP